MEWRESHDMDFSEITFLTNGNAPFGFVPNGALESKEPLTGGDIPMSERDAGEHRRTGRAG